MTYWSKRQEQLYKAMEKDEEKLKKRLSSFYDSEQRKLEKQIAAYYAEYGTDEVIRYRNLMQQLSDEDRALLIEQMDAFAEKYPQYADLMPIRESIYKLNRLEGLEYWVKMQQLEIGAVNNEEIEKYLNKQALKGVNAAAEAMGFGKAFYAENSDIIKKFVNVPWSDGKNFSTRIWENGNKLANYLSTDIAQGFARGDSYSKLVKQVQQRFSRVTRNDAYRLIYTEGTYVMAEATMQPFENDFEKYRISTVGDSRVCPICKGISSEVFDIADRVPGVNFPPFHAWCRCTFTIEVDDWDAWMDEYAEKHGSKAQREKIIKRVTSGAEDGIIKKTEWDNSLPPRGQIPEDVIEQLNGYAEADEGAYYKFIADELNIPIDRAKEYTDSIMAYTDAGSDIYSEVRRYQRQEPLQFMSEEEASKLSNDIEEYIKKSPRWNGGTTYRGATISGDELAKYRNGYQVTMGGTSSWTGTKKVAIDFSLNNASSERPNEIIYHCETQNKGTGIKHMSVFQEEDEILCSKDSIYIINKIERDNNYIYHVYLKEE